MKLATISKGFLDVFGGFAAQRRREAGGGVLARVLPGHGETFIPRTSAEVLKFYSKSPLLRMVAGRIASDMAAQNWRIFAPQSSSSKDIRYAKSVKSMTPRARHNEIKIAKQEQLLREIEVHPLKTLMTRGNEFMIGLNIRKMTQLHLDLVGEAFWLLSRNEAGVPIEAYIIPPSWVEKTPEQDEPVFTVSYRGLELKVPPSEMLWFVDPNPSVPYARGLGTAEVLGDELEVEEYASKHVKTFFQNRARPEILISGPNLGPSSAARLEARWLEKLQGFRNSYLPFFMSAPDGMQIETMSQDFESMQMIELRKHERDIVMQTFGVSPEVFGVIENSNRATIDAADFLIAKHVLTPRLEVQREFLQHRMMPQYGDESLIIDYDSPIDEDREFQWKVAKEAPHTRSVNEWREMQSLERIEDGDVYVSASNLQAYESPADIEPTVSPVSQSSGSEESEESQSGQEEDQQ